MRASSGIALIIGAGNSRSSSTAAIGIDTFMTSGRPQTAATAPPMARASATCTPLTPFAVGQRQNALRPRIDRPVNRMAEARHPAAGVADRLHQRPGHGFGVFPGTETLLRRHQQLAATFGRPDQHRTAAEQAGGKRAVERVRGRRQASSAPPERSA